MKRAKKDRPKAGTFEQSRPGLQPRNEIYDYYIKFSEKSKPQSGKEGRIPHVLGHAADLYRGGGAGFPARPPDRLDGEVKGWKDNIGAIGA